MSRDISCDGYITIFPGFLSLSYHSLAVSGTLGNGTGTLGNGTGTLWNATTTVQDFCWNAFLVIFITPSSRHRHVKRYLDSYLERYGISKLAPTYRNIIRQYLQ